MSNRVDWPASLIALAPTLIQPVFLLVVVLKSTMNIDQFVFAPSLLSMLSIVAAAVALAKIIKVSFSMDNFEMIINVKGDDNSIKPLSLTERHVMSILKPSSPSRGLITEDVRMLTLLAILFVITATIKYAKLDVGMGSEMAALCMLAQSGAYIGFLAYLASLIYTWTVFKRASALRVENHKNFMSNFKNTLVRDSHLDPGFRIIRHVTNDCGEVEIRAEISGLVSDFLVASDGANILSAEPTPTKSDYGIGFNPTEKMSMSAPELAKSLEKGTLKAGQ